MEKIKIGFIPAHREPFDEVWAGEIRERCLEVFSGNPFLEIIVPDNQLTRRGCVRDDNEALKVIDLFKKVGIHGLIIGAMTFGDEVSALAIAAAFREYPILLFGTKEDPFTDDGGRRSDSFCGTLSISSGLHRRKIPFTFAGIAFPEEPAFQNSVMDFLRVCAVSRGFTGAQVGLVGPRPERFETCIFSEDLLMRRFRQRVIPISLPDIMNRATSPENLAEIEKVVQEMKTQSVSSGIDDDTVRTIAGLEYALAQFAAEKELSGMGVQCWTAMQEVYGISPCYAMGRLIDRGIMTACEADIYGVLTMLIQYLASLRTTVPHFIDWTIKHQEQENVFLAWHCGNAPPSLVSDNSKVTLSYQSVLGKTLGIDRSYGAGEFQLKPGDVTLCRLQEHDGQFKMLVAKGKIVPSQQKLRGSWSWVEVPDLDTLYHTLVKEGFTHHASMIHGDLSRPIIDTCDYLGITPVVV